jgi:type II secretory pathway pseudopilin PulG
MVEILVAVTIIAILIGLVTVGFRRVALGGQQRATRTTLENCRAMLGEYERKNKITGFSGSLPTPGNVTAEGGAADRNGPQVIFTRSVFALLLGMPENKTAFGQFPPDQLYPNPDPTSAPAAAPAWNDGSTYTAFVSRVTFPITPLSGPKYICTADHIADTTNSPDKPGSPWIAETSTARSTTILLDAWGNPILFVPAGGLINVTLTATGPTVYRVASSGLIADQDGDGNVTDAGPPGPNEQAPARARPFFASAGPDGNFTTGDDNLYSFEN